MSVTAPYLSRPTPAQLVREVRAVGADVPLFLAAPLFRRRHRHWGATAGEVVASMPGDDLVPGAQYRCTRAVTVDAPPEAVWPWLVQVGCLRAGWYADDLLDNLGRPSATRIIPELQELRPGQWVPMGPGEPSDDTAFRVHSFEPADWLLWVKPGCTWAWVLRPLPGGRTRMVTRVRNRYDWSRPHFALLGVALLELGDFAMMRRMLLGLKERAEGAAGPAA
ncbi:MAG TPA: hypothetical protein VFM09_08575 [Marmoricola sp.]|nr:hypothetical protein [Marmoricola sp.]